MGIRIPCPVVRRAGAVPEMGISGAIARVFGGEDALFLGYAKR